jgi:acrylyl-CoA reductase (NADPH)
VGNGNGWEASMAKALVLRRQDDQVTAAVEPLDEAALPAGDVLVEVAHSTLNYKDALIILNRAPLVRNFPHVPGVDLAGRVAQSEHPDIAVGEQVLLNGWGVGERHWGGLAGLARVKGEWLTKLPPGWTTRQCMAVGTAGYSAMLAILALEEHGMQPAGGEVLVTGGAGGVGSIAIALLARQGYRIAAATGRPETEAYLRGLGAERIVPRAELAAPAPRPLETAQYQACVDAVGGATLARVLGQLHARGAVAAVGNAGGNEFAASVIPFLLRGVNLLGIDSVYQPQARRQIAWQRLASDLDLAKLEATIQDITLAEVPGHAARILQGQVRGRLVVDTQR